MNNEPKKPENIPDKAVWNPQENEWELGEKKNEKYIGEWKWWLAPKGHLCCLSHFDDDGNLTDYTRYHPDGTFSRKGTYKNGKEHGTTICQRSHNPTNEFFPPKADKSVWRTESDFIEGMIQEERYYLEDGTQVPYYGTNPPKQEEDNTENNSQSNFENIGEASKRWTEEGNKFKNGLNSWLDTIYIENKQPQNPEPEDTRSDMAEYVIKQIENFNKEGKSEDLRKMFHPSYEPLADYYKKLGKSIPQIYILNDHKILLQTFNDSQKPIVYLISENEITKQESVLAIGTSLDKKYIAKAYDDHIDIIKGWDGELSATLKYPDGYGKKFSKKYNDIKTSSLNGKTLTFESITVFPDGKSILMATDAGIFAIKESEYQFLHPDKKMTKKAVQNYLEDYEEEKAEPFRFNLDYPHASLSPNGKYIALGSYSSYHIILHEVDGKWKETAWIEPRSSYPNKAKFHTGYKHVALSSCHFRQSATTGLDLDLLPDFEASAYEADERLHYINEKFWIFSIAPEEKGYLLGDNNGYIWYMAFNNVQQIGYLHLGSTITSMDIIKNKDNSKTLVAGTYAGYVIKMNIKEGQKRDPNLITNIPVIEEKRWVFWNGYDPMAW